MGAWDESPLPIQACTNRVYAVTVCNQTRTCGRHGEQQLWSVLPAGVNWTAGWPCNACISSHRNAPWKTVKMYVQTEGLWLGSSLANSTDRTVLVVPASYISNTCMPRLVRFMFLLFQSAQLHSSWSP